ncbi:MAG: hypothetical protein ACP5P3_08765 [Ignavibacteria bacterium]
MKTLEILTFVVLVTTIFIYFYGTTHSRNISKSDSEWKKRIVVRTQDAKGNKVSNALIRVTGPQYDFCCYSDSLLGECNFSVDNNGIYHICASKNGGNDTTISVNDCQPYYLIELRLVKPTACINCDQEHIIK